MTCHRSLCAGLATLLACALMLSLPALPTAAQDGGPDREPPDPEAVADRCVAHFQRIVDRNDRAVTAISDGAVEAIERAAGHNRVIARIAHESITAVNRRSLASTRSLREACHNCLALLHGLDAPPALAEAVKAACERAANAIQDDRADAVKKIRAAVAAHTAADAA